MKWALELEEFEVIYKPRIAIKGQALADLLDEFTYPVDPVEEAELPDLPPNLQLAIPTWVLHVDRFSNKQSNGTGIILTTPKGI